MEINIIIRKCSPTYWRPREMTDDKLSLNRKKKVVKRKLAKRDNNNVEVNVAAILEAKYLAVVMYASGDSRKT